VAAPVYVVGDIHGQLPKLVRLLDGAGLINPDYLWEDGPLWTGGAATLWCLGDFFDRGPAGIGALDLIRRLQREAPADGGQVGALLGNHEVLILSAYRFRDEMTAWGRSYGESWLRSGGTLADLELITADDVAWIMELPAMAQVAGHLLIHADSLFYTKYGDSVAEVNTTLHALLAGDDSYSYDRLLDEFSERLAFYDREPLGSPDAAEVVSKFLERYGNLPRLVHGHTPIPTILRRAPFEITGPLIYADGRCINVDGGMYQGGPGFLYLLPDLDL
jgi:hypothetical protein